ncbi:mannan endo-1,4-beta-mannosidase [Synchytrium microbalum]|uniref:Mannan endo-1,4-beta-mannosidase n=1 Tax=Synchytrium microbalum TaxID=1806994 RepID=A0A507C4X2_9FUNG|nr:mannan endo-1,4-beta-mannosidase [Synchytrium microbalum]TPX33036.1 mannan endo-1,4-beta-mannosidase [Synchytrium microbalum]
MGTWAVPPTIRWWGVLMLASMYCLQVKSALFEPPDNAAYVMAWLDTAHNDTPAACNQRTGRDWPMYQLTQTIPTNSSTNPIPNVDTTAPTYLLDGTGTDAFLFLTIYPLSAGDMLYVTDADIQALAAQMKALNDKGRRVLMRIAPEMNANWYPYGQKPSLYIPFFRKIVIAVRKVAPLVAFVWSPTVRGLESFPAQNAVPGTLDFTLQDTNNDGVVNSFDDPYSCYYPGDAYVDWVGLTLKYLPPQQPYVVNTAPSIQTFLLSMEGAGTGNTGIAYDFYQLFVVGHDKPFCCSDCSAAFYLAGIFPDAISVPEGPGELFVKQSWWQQTITSSTTHSFYPRIKIWGLYEFRRVANNTYQDFQILNDTDPNGILPAFLQDVGSSSIRILTANKTSVVVTPPNAPSSSTKSSSHRKLNISWLTLIFLIPSLILIVQTQC